MNYIPTEQIYLMSSRGCFWLKASIEASAMIVWVCHLR